MSIEAMKQALEALENIDRWLPTIGQRGLRDYEFDAICALRQAIEQAEKNEHPMRALLKQAFGQPSEIPKIGCVNHDCDKCQAIQQAEKQKPVALKNGECWPEYVMEEWDYWRKQIADGDKGSAPRDWFEELAELKLVTAQPQQDKKPSEGGDCDSPSWCKQYGKCHRKVVGAPTLANCMEETEKQGQLGASLVTKPEYVAEQKEKTRQMRKMLDMPHDRKVAMAYGIPQPQREWVGLTKKELYEIHDSSRDRLSALCAIEAKLKDKNT